MRNAGVKMNDRKLRRWFKREGKLPREKILLLLAIADAAGVSWQQGKLRLGSIRCKTKIPVYC